MNNDKPQRIVIEGELNIYTASEWKKRLDDLINQSFDIELDLSDVKELDTAGLQLLIMAKKEATHLNKKLSLINYSPIVLEVFDLCGVTTYFDIPTSPSDPLMKGSAHEL